MQGSILPKDKRFSSPQGSNYKLGYTKSKNSHILETTLTKLKKET